MPKDFSGPGRSDREGISLLELTELFPDEDSARAWFEAQMWPSGRCCGKCGSVDTHEVKGHKPMPYRCRDCRGYFSVRTGTILESSRLPLRKWAFAIYLYLTNIKGLSSMKLHRDIEVTQKTAWFMLHRIREAYSFALPDEPFRGPVEVDETYMGGKERNKHANKKLRAGRGAVGKTPVVGTKDRESNAVSAHVVDRTDAVTLGTFVLDHIDEDAMVYTDGSGVYAGLLNHEAVKHSIGEYVRGMVHTNGMESFWAMLKRGYHGIYHRMSPKHLQRYVNEFAGRHNIRDLDTLDQMRDAVARMIGRRLMYRDLTKG